MRLHAAAVRFDKSILTDAYTGDPAGKGQLVNSDYYKLDGAAVTRRIITVHPSTIIPARRVIALGGVNYIVGDPSTDHFADAPIRTSYVLHQTPGLATVKTIAEALAGTAGVTMYASREWNKDVADLQHSSDYFNDYHIFVSSTETVSTGLLVFIDNQWHYCHAIHPSLSGFTDMVSHEILGTVFETITATAKTYNPVTDTYTDSSASVTVLRLRWQQRFEYLTVAQETYQRGDETLVVLKSARPGLKPSDTFTLSDGMWRVLSVRDDGLTLSAHVRR